VGSAACLIGSAEDGGLMIDPRLITQEEEVFLLARPGSVKLIGNRSVVGAPGAFTRGFSAPGGLSLAALHLRSREEAKATELSHFFPLEVLFAGASTPPKTLGQQQTYEVVSAALVRGHLLAISCGKNGGAGNLIVDPEGRTGISSQSLGDGLNALSLCASPFVLGADRQAGGGVVLRLGEPASLVRVDLTPAPGAFSLEGTAETLPGVVPALEPAAVRHVERGADGISRILTESGGVWRQEAVGQGSAEIAVQGAVVGQDSVWRGADGALRIATLEGLYRWAPPEAPALIAASPPPGIDAPWEPMDWRGGARAVLSAPNPAEPSLSIPQSVRLRVASDDGFEVIEAPPTPCSDGDACRRFGESEVVGVVGEGEHRRVIYEVWSWVLREDAKGSTACIAAPLR
jgi:hypothetical protein